MPEDYKPQDPAASCADPHCAMANVIAEAHDAGQLELIPHVDIAEPP
jgi:hypothetical protein